MKDNWTKAPIISFADVISGGTPSTNIQEFWDGDIVWITPADLSKIKTANIYTSSRKISKLGLQSSSANLIPENSIVMSSRAPIGYFAIPSVAFTTNQGCKSIVLKQNQNQNFHYYNFVFNVDRFKEKGEGTTFAEISKKEVEKIEFSLPPLPQQKKIAQILTTCDTVIEKTEATIAKYQAMKQGLMHDLFTRGIDIKTGKLRPKQEDAPELYKESELGWIPKEWEVKRLDEFLGMRSGDTITSEQIENSGEYSVFGGNGLRGFASKYTHNGDYILIGRQGALCGNITVATGKFYASEHAVVVTILDNSNINWLSEKLHNMNLNQYSEASAQPGLSVNKIQKIKISLPNEYEQIKISEKFLSINIRIITEQSYLSKYQKLKTGLMQDLLTGKVEVKV
ncbi:restriction endonuclease subunit S [Chryseobacterium sp.]|uniref:restriction endonuclease subunit S n=1 Tax=Chryseobacterium sp. TaxID=1871047 RepID=UPI0031D57FE9